MLLVPRYPGTVAIRGAVRACRRVDVMDIVGAKSAQKEQHMEGLEEAAA